MRSVTAHQEVVAALFAPPQPVRLPVADAVGLATTSAVIAPIGLPGFDNSSMDGYAVRADDVAGAGPDTPVTLPVTADIPAGRTDELCLSPGTAHRIMTGAPLPVGADAVIPVEAVHTDDPLAQITVTASSAAGTFVRRAGSDIAAGDPALPAGTVIGAAQVGLLAALGHTDVEVARRLRVVVLSTGSELVEPGQPLRYGQIHESNGAMLRVACTEAGASTRQVHFVPDDADEFLARLADIADDADLIITSGGVSAGAFEVVKEALSPGSESPGDGTSDETPRSPAQSAVEFVKVAMQPGMPQGGGRLRDSTGRDIPIITLPGNPVSSLVSFEVFIRPALRRAMALPADRPRLRARLDTALTSPDGKRQFRRALLSPGERSGEMPVATPVGPAGSHHLRYLAAADALLDIPADVTSLDAGIGVDVICLH